ncbi:uncharacterized protein BO97DRAFT_212557 [Aspergillus homomorphus CBS 101889]|uniref:GPI anchored protein n=1 Tax=Aspergillus homomorphus (strain CBS 101889) TaxID=1450537 RepID=A0A395I6I9_ASPHC|nr:hypothetical protein BO97DRAFT_212557 [Aspergillus homomorphus CBS 101889]RAL15455.1 hypothetical protein BO97DRAFT_212557 [Aspergillus homomorphus CBS 101889]
MFFKVPLKFAVLLTVWFFATMTLATETFANVGNVYDDEVLIAIPIAKRELDPRDVTIIKTICETSTSVISATAPANPPAAGTTVVELPPANPTGQPSSPSESHGAPPAHPTTVPGTVVLPPVTSKPEGVSPTSAPGTTVQPPVTSKTEAVSSPTSNTQATHSVPYTSASHSSSPVSSSAQNVTHSATTLTTGATSTSAASSTHTTAPPSSAATGLNGMRSAAILAFVATFVVFFSI